MKDLWIKANLHEQEIIRVAEHLADEDNRDFLIYKFSIDLVERLIKNLEVVLTEMK